ncbi:MAG: hypothetical protein ACR2KB_06205 [Chitinophagaceae bacterium]
MVDAEDLYAYNSKAMSNTNIKHEVVEVDNAKAHNIVELLEYVPNGVLTKTILKKTTGNVTVTSMDAGEELTEKTLPFDMFIQIIDGTAEMQIK